MEIPLSNLEKSLSKNNIKYIYFHNSMKDYPYFTIMKKYFNSKGYKILNHPKEIKANNNLAVIYLHPAYSLRSSQTYIRKIKDNPNAHSFIFHPTGKILYVPPHIPLYKKIFKTFFRI